MNNWPSLKPSWPIATSTKPRKDELRERLAEQSRLKSREAQLEEAWLNALEHLEQLQQQLEDSL